jgi:hypothetical protein
VQYAQMHYAISFRGFGRSIAIGLGNNAAYLAFAYALYLKLLRIRGSANPFNPMKLFTRPQEPGSSLASIPGLLLTPT